MIKEIGVAEQYISGDLNSLEWLPNEGERVLLKLNGKVYSVMLGDIVSAQIAPTTQVS